MTSSEMTPSLPGNTKQARPKARNFILTINEKVMPHLGDILTYVENLKAFQYVLVTEHFGQENKHYHMYVQFNQNTPLSVKKLHGAHIEPSFGSAQQNIAYLKCEDEKHKKLGITYQQIYEKGEAKFNGGFKTIQQVKQLDTNELDELPIQYYNIVQKIKSERECDIDIDDWHKDVKVFYIQGPSGIGKTEKAKSIVRGLAHIYGRSINVVKYEKGFWSGCLGNAKIAIYDDFRDSHLPASEFINFIDYNTHYMNIKGGTKTNNYNLIIITSVQKLDEIYRNMDDEPRKQWVRRVELINMYESENDDIDIDML